MTLIPALIAETNDILLGVRRNLRKVAENLFLLRENKANGDDPWGKWVEENIEISQSFASKLVDNWEQYIITGGLDPQRLEGVDYEKLYLASKTGTDAELNLSRAMTLTRAELREANVDGGHIHSGEIVKIHKCCGMIVHEENPF